MSTTGWIVLGVAVVVVIWAISIYNSLVAMRQRTNQAFADIDVQLKQRHDLIPNLVETVKGYAAHERGTLEAVIQARNAAVAAPGVEQKVAAENVRCGSYSRCRKIIRTSKPTRTSSSCRATCPISRTSSRPPAASSITPCRNTTPVSSNFRRRYSPEFLASRNASFSISAKAAPSSIRHQASSFSLRHFGAPAMPANPE
jgi:LemA family protein